ncbi:MAG: hypothetical protein KatS3mg011_1427 [Acidimicrobiia bacterium]|nr:MAG: hypothetical protein KatS3mg011_1427 [Acidimicrobiia bacterium]
MWQTAADLPELDEWVPNVDIDPDRADTRRRILRLLAVLVLLGLAGGIGWYATRWQENRQTAALATVAATADGLAQAAARLHETVTELADLGSPLSDPAVTAQYDEASRELFETASRLDPNQPRTGSVRALALETAQQALEIEQVVGDALTYRSALVALLQPPDLPADANSRDVPQVVADVTDWVGRFRSTVDAMPGSPLLDTHRRLMAETATWLESWQTGYADALREGDAGSARFHIDLLERRLRAVEVAWSDTSQELIEWATEAFQVLSERLTELSTRAG